MKILIRYGEIALKSTPVRRRMESLLTRNLRQALSQQGIQASVKRSFGRIFLETTEPKKATALLKKIFGIVSFSPCSQCPADIDSIKTLALTLAKAHSFKTFAVKARRVGSHKFKSQDVNKAIGATICTLKKKVNLSSPDLTLWIEVRDKTSYLYTEKIPGQCGFPLGSHGKVPALLETQQDLLAAWLMMRRGCEIIPVTKKESFLKILEEWAFHPLPQEPSLEEALKKHPFGIVSANPAHASELKARYKVPVYNPLLGISKDQEKEILKTLK
ncbi:MAG: hypothetical protein ISS93_01930 [Candidatus Aenigmarchaeota archaeon]|nr:hypothetical protein [Candidatus Aenigmarchaeota archaeon]